MLTYKEYEKAVFDWLITKNQNDPTFTFSLRKNGMKGSECDYFIGTEKSNYFGPTLWKIPISFPGNTTDFINIFFEFSSNSKPTYYFQIYQTRNPVGEQNIVALRLAKTLKIRLKATFATIKESKDDGKFEIYSVQPREFDYETLNDLFQDLEKDLEIFIPIVDEELAKIKSENQSFTGHRITNDEFNSFREKMGKRIEKYGNQVINIPTIDNSKIITSDINMANNQPLNQILYGPPGTGKTYHTINHAIAIIEGKDIEAVKRENRNDILNRFEVYKQNGLIAFVTFHQSFSYEDFVEGIKPQTVGEEDNRSVVYEIQDGIFKTIANNAINVSKFVHSTERNNLFISSETLNKIDYFKMSLGKSNDADDDPIYDYCKENNVIALGWGDDIDFTNVQTAEELKQLFIEKGFNSTDYSLIALKCLKFWMKKNDIVFISNGNSRVRAIGQIVGDYYFDADTEIRYKHFRPVKWLSTDLDIPVEMVYEKRFSQQSIYQMYNSKIKQDFFQQDSQENPKHTSDNYVMIIDEINRGNVSQIFGELITLLEEDKRSGVENGMPLSLTLPYSKKPFSVPNNLYIIGTMNTADRSVEALDTALRRRFSFEEMPPCYDLEELEYEITSGITANQLLKTINNRIEKLLDKDHLIGHSFLIKKVDEDALEKVMETFYKNIIPLLQEYFFGDYGKIGLILGNGFVNKKVDTEIAFAQFEYDIETKEMYEIIDHRREANSKQTFESAIKKLMNI
jgi:hypothetical protein